MLKCILFSQAMSAIWALVCLAVSIIIPIIPLATGRGGGAQTRIQTFVAAYCCGMCEKPDPIGGKVQSAPQNPDATVGEDREV